MTLPRYVDYSGLICLPPAFDSVDTSLWGFWAEADGAKLEALCRRLFAEPSGGEIDYRPIGSHVMLSWGRIGSVNSMTPPFDKMGAVEEDQVAVWIPVVQVKQKGDELEAQKFAMFRRVHLARQPDVAGHRARGLRLSQELGLADVPDRRP
jgi:hypothetical protein